MERLTALVVFNCTPSTRGRFKL